MLMLPFVLFVATALHPTYRKNFFWPPMVSTPRGCIDRHPRGAGPLNAGSWSRVRDHFGDHFRSLDVHRRAVILSSSGHSFLAMTIPTQEQSRNPFFIRAFVQTNDGRKPPPSNAARRNPFFIRAFVLAMTIPTQEQSRNPFFIRAFVQTSPPQYVG